MWDMENNRGRRLLTIGAGCGKMVGRMAKGHHGDLNGPGGIPPQLASRMRSGDQRPEGIAMDNRTFIRTCQSCGYRLVCQPPDSKTWDRYSERKCPKCKSIDFDYGSYQSEE
jgi:predicted nucleic-acid-binding Zn-ribbon protein